MKHILSFIIIPLLLCGTLLGSSKDQDFKGSITEVWSACSKAAAEKFSLTFSDPTSHILTFSTGYSLRSQGMNASVTLKEVGNNTVRVTVTPQKTKEKWSLGAGGSIADKYFKAVSENLK